MHKPTVYQQQLFLFELTYFKQMHIVGAEKCSRESGGDSDGVTSTTKLFDGRVLLFSDVG